MLTFCINLDRSPDRWRGMQVRFPGEDLIRVPAVDGSCWENGHVDPDGRPQWDEEARAELIAEGILAPAWCSVHRLIPCELGCTLSHASVWRLMVEDNIASALILEDDIRLSESGDTPLQQRFTMPQDADVLFLSGSNRQYHFGDRIWRKCVTINEYGRLIKGYGTYAYVITQRGAEIALGAIKHTVLPLPKQWFLRAFRGYRGYHPQLTPLASQCNAYALEKAVIEVSEEDEKSTMTSYGGKPWRSGIKRHRR